MSRPIWPVVTENLAQQLAAAQGGIVHSTQLMPYLPLSLELIEQTLDALADSGRVQKKTLNGFSAYFFEEFINQTPRNFAPRHCVYSNELLSNREHSVICPEVRKTIEAELTRLATNESWPTQAVWQHELLYLAANLPAPLSTRSIADNSRLPYRRVEEGLRCLQQQNALQIDPTLNAWALPPLHYSRTAYLHQDAFILRFPEATEEMHEIRLIRALGYALSILGLSFALAVIGRIPFFLVFIGGLICAALMFLKIAKSPLKQIPKL